MLRLEGEELLPNDKRIQSKAQLKDWIKYESKLYGKQSFIRLVFPVTELDILRKHQIILRKTEYSINTNHLLRCRINKIRLNIIQNKYALHIPPNTCGRGLKVMHVGPILINGRATIGKDCVLHMNTAIVANGASDAVPTIGDEVIIGYGAVVVGGVYVTDKVAIGANAVVVKNIAEPDVAIAGIPAKIVSSHGRSSWNKKQ